MIMATKPQPLAKKAEVAVAIAMRQLGLWLDQRFTEEISAVKWSYPTPPEVRDIVDTGRLRAAQTRQDTPEGSVFTWPVDYAQQVHEGGVSTRTRRPFPGRPWTKLPLEQAPEKFGEFMDRALGSQR